MSKTLTKDRYEKLRENQIRLWTEDDALPPGAETLISALKRIFDYWPNGRAKVYEEDQGDAVISVYEMNRGKDTYVILCQSYRGNNSIDVARFCPECGHKDVKLSPYEDNDE